MYEAILDGLRITCSWEKGLVFVTEEKEWTEEWEALAQKIDNAWKSDKSALEILTEMRDRIQLE